jgi:tetratricopeptide (TPR) repeat protein
VIAFEELHDPEGALRAHTAIGVAFNSYYRADEAVADLEPVFQAIDAFDTAPRVRLGLEMARAYMLNAQPELAIEVAERALPQAERYAPAAAVIDGIISKATALSNLGRLLEAQATLLGAIALADQLDLPRQATRGLNNLATVQTALDPQASLRTSESLLERTARFGDGGWVARTRADFAEQLIAMGRYDEALAMYDALDTDRLAPAQKNWIAANRSWIEGVRALPPGIGQRLRDQLAAYPVSDPQVRMYFEWFKLSSYILDRDWERVAREGANIPLPWSLEGALLASIRLRDAELGAAALTAIERDLPASGRLGRALRHLGEGAIQVLRENHDEGMATMGAGMELMTKVGLPVEVADWQTAFAGLVGLDHPAALAPATAAQEWLRSVGAHGLEQIWADGLPADTAAARRVG